MCKVGDTVKVKVISIADNGKIALSIKQAVDKPQRPQRDDRPDKQDRAPQRRPAKKSQDKPKHTAAPPVLYPDGVWEEQVSSNPDFEDMMSRFKKSSQDRMSDLKRGGEGRGYSRRGNGSGRK